MSNELKAEVFAVGKWNGINVEPSDLNEIVAAFKKLGDNHRVPLKLGHNKEQTITDGHPALGWVSDVWVEGSKLMAKFSDVPDVLMKAIEKKLYKNVSIELDAGVQWKQDFFKYVLSGVAILGADIPAVNVLADLTAYMKRGSADYSRKNTLTFTYVDQEKTMTDEATLKAAQDEAASLKAQLATIRTEQDTAKFTTAKNDLQAKLDGLVKDGVIIPAQREKFMAGVTKDNIESFNFSVSAIAEGSPKKTTHSDEQAAAGKGKTEDSTGKLASDVLFSKAKKLAVEKSITFSQAQRQVMEVEPDLAREYMLMNVGE